MNYTALESASSLIKSKTYIKHKSICNIGINDSKTPIKIDGKHIKAYSIWYGMMTRCYSTNRSRNPTYTNCTVDKEWHLFSNFEQWFTKNYVEGWHLDKDILVPGNKVYSAKVCVFVPQALNSLLLDHAAARGECPLGVYFHKNSQKYLAKISVEACRKHLGYFSTSLEAHRAWQLAKADSLEGAETNNPLIRSALDLRAAKLREDHTNRRITTKL